MGIVEAIDVKLIDCLKQLPPSMRMVDLLEIPSKVKTVAEIIEGLGHHGNEDGFEVREHRGTHGVKVKSVGVVGGPNLLIERRR
jgi:hypothetical protein